MIYRFENLFVIDLFRIFVFPGSRSTNYTLFLFCLTFVSEIIIARPSFVILNQGIKNSFAIYFYLKRDLLNKRYRHTSKLCCYTPVST